MNNTQKPKLNVLLKNALTNEVVKVDILRDDEIEGKKFWIVKMNQRVLLLAKDAYSVVRSQ